MTQDNFDYIESMKRSLVWFGVIGLRTAGFIGCCLFFKPSPAQTADSLRIIIREDTLQTVVVSAARAPQALFTIPFSIHRLIDPIHQQSLPRTLPEAMSWIPGVFVQKTNHGGGSPFLRGLTGNQTLLMLDGIRVNNSTFRFGPNQYTNLLDGFTLQRVEALKGTGSVQYGSDALGGVVHAYSRDLALNHEGRWLARAATRITTQDMEYTARAEAGYSGQKAAIRMGYSWRQFGDLYGGDTTGKQSPSGYDERNWDLKAKLAIGKRTSLTLSAQQVGQRNVPLYHRVQLENFEYYRFDPQKLLLAYLKLEGEKEGMHLKSWSITPLFKKSVEGRQFHRNGSSQFTDERDEVISYGMIAESYWKIAPGWTSTTGVEIYLDQVSSQRNIQHAGGTSSVRGLYPDGAGQTNGSVFSLHHLNRGKWKSELGLRYTFVQNRIPGKYLDLPGANADDAALNVSALVWNASLLYQLRTKQVIYINSSTGFRAPGIDDLGTLGLVDFRYELPAYDLRPEKNINYELGYRYHGDGFKVQAALFYMELKDLISRVRNQNDSLQGYPVYIKTNDQRALIRGFEASGSFSPFPRLLISASMAAQYGQNLTRDEPLRRVPPFNGLAGVRYVSSAWYAGMEMQWAARQDRLAQGDLADNRIPAGGTPGWQVFNLQAGWARGPFDCKASLINLFNVDYRTHGSGINGMGRALTLSLTVGLP